MAKKRRLILALQYPTPMRYQEWWPWEIIRNATNFFTEIVNLGRGYPGSLDRDDLVGTLDGSSFSNTQRAGDYELFQIQEYLKLDINQESDYLLLCDLSFPGFFANALLLKKPYRAVAICHATSKNKHDFFSNVCDIKYPIEEALAKLFDKIIVGSQYHKKKLGWPNIKVVHLPRLPFDGKYLPRQCTPLEDRADSIICVSRNSIQKRDMLIEGKLSKNLGIDIDSIGITSEWNMYYTILNQYKVMLITAKEETFGYQILDAIYAGCIPVAPNRCSYPELLPKELLYNNFTELCDIVRDIFKNSKEYKDMEYPASTRNRYFYGTLFGAVLGYKDKDED